MEWLQELKHRLGCVLLLLNDSTLRRADLDAEQDDRLWVSDPKAIQYILQSSRHNIEKPFAARFALNTATGPGVSGAEGDLHRLSILSST
jgi:hypothetical protein